MDVGMFQTPFMRPERSAGQVFDWAVDQAILADQIGFAEYYVGEHATLNWESVPSPELVIAAAAHQTKQIKLGPLAHLLPYHHPSTLAIQTGWMSQILEGRYVLGVAAGAYPTDAALRGIDDMSVNHKMLFEAIEIMERIWKGEPYGPEQSEFWKHGFPADDPAHPDHAMRDMAPHGGKMQLAMTGLSPKSDSIEYAARHGYLPVSVYAGNDFLRSHWEIYSRVAGENGHPADRSMHRVVRDVFVAETDAEAKKWAIEGGLGHAWAEYIGPTYKRFGVMEGLLADPSHSVDDVDAEYLAEHVWIVGSPETVIAKFEREFDELGGGYGTHLIYGHDYLDNPEPWNESMRLLVQEVAPNVQIKSAAGTG